MRLSVIIPVHNGGDDFFLCLEALRSSEKAPDEIIVVDDASTDNSVIYANQFRAHILSLGSKCQGPAVARNRGATIAHGDVLVFIDADVAVHPDTLTRIARYFYKNPDISALFGSYDNTPSKKGFVSRYKNLQHHYVHQHSLRDADTFWAGCGAIRRDVFLQLGGFSESYTRPSIEDVELGMRLKASGHRIWLCPDVQAKHLKRWTLYSLFHSDIVDRAIPWTRLILSLPHIPSNLNLDQKSRFSAIAAWVFLFSFVIGLSRPLWWLGTLICGAVVLALNFGLYRLFFQRGGQFFIIAAIGLHWLYYLYSSFIFTILFIHRGIKRILFLPEELNHPGHTVRG